MPIYEYRCADCGKTFEAIQKFSDEPFRNCGQSSVVCERKGEGRVERQLTAPTFQFKGSGFYITDYANGKGAAKDGSDGKSASASDSGSDSGSSTKSESKSESKSDSKVESKPESKAAPKSAESKPAATTKSDT